INLRSGHALAQWSVLPQTKQPSFVSFPFFFLNVVICLGLSFFSCFFFLLRDALEFFFCTTLALEDSTPFSRVSFALAFSSTSRVPMRSLTLNSCLLCFREVAKSFQEGGNLEIIPPATNLSGNTHGNCSSSFASCCIS